MGIAKDETGVRRVNLGVYCHNRFALTEDTWSVLAARYVMDPNGAHRVPFGIDTRTNVNVNTYLVKKDRKSVLANCLRRLRRSEIQSEGSV